MNLFTNSSSLVQRAYRARPKSAFSQNFLVDQTALASIAELVDPGPGDKIVELGAGLGFLTEALLARLGEEGELVAVDLDKDMIASLPEHHSLTPMLGDASSLDWREFSGNYKICGNLPFHVATRILTGILGDFSQAYWRASQASKAVLMFQWEVTERILGRSAGWLSVLVAAKCHADLGLRVPAASFVPPPRVDAGVVVLRPRGSGDNPLLVLDPPQRTRLATLVEGAFSRRRKMLRNALPGIDVRAAGIDANLRPENLSLENWISLAKLGSP